MSGYERKSLQILGGGFNPLPPGDKVPKTDYLLAQNWRTDRPGKLESRAGFTPKGSFTGVAYLHSAALFGGNVYWAASPVTLPGLNGRLFFGTNPTAIATGFDANRMGMVPMNGWMWVMNRNKQGRHNAANAFQNWNLTAPAGAPSAAVGAGDANGPNGTYTVYVTFGTSDLTLESNPSPASGSVTVALQDISVTSIPVSADSRVGLRNIYLSGGSLGQPYLVGTINDNSTTTFTITMNDLAATNQGIVMPTTNDAPPAAAGMAGPYYSRLLAWSTSGNVNRLWWTKPALPQYWPGAANPSTGQWVDVGDDGEAIVWVTLHTNVAIIYKERSIWRLVGDPDTGFLEKMDASLGLVNAFGVANAGAFDFFVGPGGLYKNNLDSIENSTGVLAPLFNSALYSTSPVNAGPLTPPGAINQAGSFNFTSGFAFYDISLGWGMGKLYIAYNERSSLALGQAEPALLVGSGDRWMYYRTSLLGIGRFRGFLFDGTAMIGLGGDTLQTASAWNLDDFSLGYTEDNALQAIECVYQSHYEDAGLPDNQKMWLEVAIDYEFAGDTATVYAGYNTGATALAALGTITGSGRQTASFPLNQLAKNISIAIDCVASGKVLIHNVYLYYYVEARLAVSAATLPLDLGSPRFKQAKELELDIDASLGPVTVNVSSDLPGNAIALRQPLALARTGGRGVMKLPFPVTEGYLWRLQLLAQQNNQPFRLYSARLLMRPIGVYVEAYEAAAGFVWDSMPATFDSGITHVPRQYAIALAALPIKQCREITLEIETFGGSVTVNFLSDLPGDSLQIAYSTVVNTGSSGRRFVRIPLPTAQYAVVEGRMFQLQLAGASKFILYDAAVELLPIGVYLEAYEASGGARYDSRELDFGSQTVKQCREVELDIFAFGSYTVTVLTDLPGNSMAARVTQTNGATNGRTKVQIPLPQGQVPENYIFGRLIQLVITSASAFKLFGARVHLRPIGLYVESYEAAAGAVWDSTPTDLGSPADKSFDQVQIEMDTDGAATLAVYTDLPGESFASRGTYALTNGATSRHWATVVLPGSTAGAPAAPWSIEGRSIRLIVSSTAGFRIYKARVRSAAVGRYLAATTAAGTNDVLKTLDFDFQSAKVKIHKKVEIDLLADGVVTLNLYTEENGQLASVWQTQVSTPTGRTAFSLSMPPGMRGRLLRIALTSPAPARIYRLRVWSRAVNEARAEWGWQEYPIEPSDVVPKWADLEVPETPAGFTWAPAPVNPTEPQWFWAKVLAVDETPDKWEFIDVPFEVAE